MLKVIFPTLGLFVPVLLIATAARAAPPAAEDRYIAARDVAIEKLSAIYDAGKFDDAAQKVEDAATSDLTAQLGAILHESAREGFGPAKLHLGSFYKGDEGFGTIDGLRFDALLGRNGQKAGANGADGKYVQPRAHIIVTTQTLFVRWLRANKEWWDDKIKDVPQQIGVALRDESFYTQAVSNGSAVVKLASLPIAKPSNASYVYGMLGGQTQSEIPNAADEVFLSAIANGKVYLAYGSIKPEVKIPACNAIRTSYNKKAEQADDDLRFEKIDKKAYDNLGDLRQKGEDGYKRCFAERAAKEASFAAAVKQAQALLTVAMGR